MPVETVMYVVSFFLTNKVTHSVLPVPGPRAVVSFSSTPDLKYEPVHGASRIARVAASAHASIFICCPARTDPTFHASVHELLIAHISMF